MKMAIAYNKDDYKLSDKSYSKNYRDMFDCLIERFDEVEHITDSCSAKADVLIYFDPHSSHHITVDSDALKYEYFNDPHQKDVFGKYTEGPFVHKLGAEQRSKRALDRGVDFAICPSKAGYDKYLKPYLGDRLFWFPVVPRKPKMSIPFLKDRKPWVIGSGHLAQGHNGFRPYDFRRWAYSQPGVSVLPHYAQNPATPVREQYMKLLTYMAGALALCDTYVVAKYVENSLCGCVNFIQWLPECEMLGFEDGTNCICVTKDNFEIVEEFKKDPESYQDIADAGRELMENNWTAEKFAESVYRHAEARV